MTPAARRTFPLNKNRNGRVVFPVGKIQTQYVPNPAVQPRKPPENCVPLLQAVLLPIINAKRKRPARAQQPQGLLQGGERGPGCGVNAVVPAGEPSQVKNNAPRLR